MDRYRWAEVLVGDQSIVTEDLPFLPLYQQVKPLVARAKLQNFRPSSLSPFF